MVIDLNSGLWGLSATSGICQWKRNVSLSHFFLPDAVIWIGYTTAPPTHPILWSGSQVLPMLPVLERSGKVGVSHWWLWGSLGMLASGCLSPDTQIKVQVSFCHSRFNFLYDIHLSLFLTDSVMSDAIFEKLQSCQSRLSCILIINRPQISVAQINKGFFLVLSHGHVFP